MKTISTSLLSSLPRRYLREIDEYHPKHGAMQRVPADDRGDAARLELLKLTHHNASHLFDFRTGYSGAKMSTIRARAHTNVLFRQVLPQPQRDPGPAIAQAFVALVLPALPRRLARLLLDFDDLGLLRDVLRLDAIVHLEVVQTAQPEVVEANRSRGTDAVYGAEEREGLKAL